MEKHNRREDKNRLLARVVEDVGCEERLGTRFQQRLEEFMSRERLRFGALSEGSA